MGFDVYRLVVDWTETVAGFRAARGGSYFWDVLDLPEGPPKVAHVRWFEGALAGLPSKREFEATEIYDAIRPHLAEAHRLLCDEVFGALFWPGEGEGGIGSSARDLELEAGFRGDDLFLSMNPASVHRVLEKLRLLPERALLAAYDAADPPHGPYLPEFVDFFENHLGNHRAQLEDAARTGSGLVGLLSF